MEILNLVAAIILQNNKVLIIKKQTSNAQEFPNGKIKPYESHEDALKRDILEKLTLKISVNKYLSTTNYNYSDYSLNTFNYICSINEGTPILHDHSEVKWVNLNDLDNINFTPTYIKVANDLKKEFNK